MTSSTPVPPPVVGRMVRRAVLGGLAASLATALVLPLVLHPAVRAGWSALLGGGVATVALGGGLLAVRWLLGQPGAVVLPGIFLVLLVVVVLLTALALALRESVEVHRGAFAAGALAAVILAQVALVHAYLTGPRPLLETGTEGQA